jgi:hypothetical protein
MKYAISKSSVDTFSSLSCRLKVVLMKNVMKASDTDSCTSCRVAEILIIEVIRPDDGGSKHFRIAGKLLPDYTAASRNVANFILYIVYSNGLV